MDLLPSGSDKILEIRTEFVDIVVKTKGKKTSGTVMNADSKSSSLKVMAANIEHISIPAQNLREEYSDHKGIAIHEWPVFPMFFEQTDYIVTIKSRKQQEISFQSNSSLIEGQINYVIEDDLSLLSGVINYGNNVGFSDFIVIADGKRVLSIRLEVYPTKISYKEDYQQMMSDINDLVNESILDFMKKAYHVFAPNHKRSDVPVVFFTILQTVYNKYIQSLNRIMALPNHKLVSEHEVVAYYKADRTDNRSIRWLQKHPEYLLKRENKVLAYRVLSVKKQITYNTQENRIVKFMLQSTIRRIDDFRDRYLRCSPVPDTNITSGICKMKNELHRYLTTSFMADVSEYNAVQSMSLVFGMAPGYRELYKYYLMLQNGFSVGGDVFHLSEKDTAQLYEYWCFIKLYDILRTSKTNKGDNRYKLTSPDIIRVDKKGITVDLAKGRASTVRFINSKTGELISLTYNPTESKTQTVNQRPDNVLELEKKGSDIAYKYVFDAKYRIETNPDGFFYPDNKPGPKVEDINTMHRYRDSIVYENPNSKFTFEKTMFGAYILFPYNEEEEYRGHRFYRSIDSVNIGGLPFLPSATTLVKELLEALIADSPESAFERATLPAGIEDRLKVVNWDKRDVLIGLVSDDAHKKIFVKNKYYFTRRFDCKNLPIRYVALYEKGSGISRYGELISWSQEKRSNLPGESQYADELYHVFVVQKWKMLKEPITMEEAGPNPIAYTNYFLLSTSKTYSELRLRNEADYRLFTELKRRTDARILEETDDVIAFEAGNSKMMLDRDKIYVLNKGEITGFCTVDDFNRRPNAVFRQLQSYIRE